MMIITVISVLAMVGRFVVLLYAGNVFLIPPSFRWCVICYMLGVMIYVLYVNIYALCVMCYVLYVNIYALCVM